MELDFDGYFPRFGAQIPMQILFCQRALEIGKWHIIQVTSYDSWPWCVFFCEKFGATGHELKEQDSKGRRANFLVSILMRKVSVISLIQCQCFHHIISHHIYNAMQLQYVSLSYQNCIINIISETPTCCSFLFAFFQARKIFVGKSLKIQATLK